MLLLEEQIKEKTFSTGSWFNIRIPLNSDLLAVSLKWESHFDHLTYNGCKATSSLMYFVIVSMISDSVKVALPLPFHTLICKVDISFSDHLILHTFWPSMPVHSPSVVSFHLQCKTVLQTTLFYYLLYIYKLSIFPFLFNTKTKKGGGGIILYKYGAPSHENCIVKKQK